MTMMKSDKQLIDSYLSGNDLAFDELYERYRLPLFSYLNRMTSYKLELSDDLFQKTWIKIIKNLSRYRDQDNFLAWSYRIAHNNVIDHYRKENKSFYDELHEDLPCVLKAPSDHVHLGEFSEALETAISSLPLEQKEVFLLRKDKVSFKEIAKHQKVSLNTALGRMHYALGNLRKNLQVWRS